MEFFVSTMQSKYLKVKISILLFSLFFVSCKNNEEVETATIGKLNLTVSDDVFPITEIQVNEFMRLYPDAKIKLISTSSRDAIVQLLNDSVEIIVSGRNLNKEEKEVAIKNEIKIDSILIAYEGIAVIVNNKNKVSQITTNEIKNILNGKIFNWSNIKGSNLQSKILLNFCGVNDGVNEFLRGRFFGGDNFSATSIVCKNSEEVISNVEKYDNSIGFISQNWIEIKKENIKVLDVHDPNYYRDSVKKEVEYFSIHQANIYRNYYPLWRKLFILHRNIRDGVGVGFSTHVATNIGQQIFVKNGLVPATLPVRLVQLSNEEL